MLFYHRHISMSMIVFFYISVSSLPLPCMPETTALRVEVKTLYRFFIRCTSSSNFLFDRFKCLLLPTNLHFSSIIQRSFMETKCCSCPWIVSVYASHQYCFCVVKICGHCVHTKHKKVRSAGNVSCSSQGWTHTNTGCVMPYSMVIHFLWFCE